MPDTLLDVKHRLSDALLDAGGVSGVGLRGESIVVYLETGDADTKQRVANTVARLAPKVPIVYEVAGRFEKQ